MYELLVDLVSTTNRALSVFAFEKGAIADIMGQGGKSAPQVPWHWQILCRNSESRGEIHDFLNEKMTFCLSLDFLVHLIS